MLSLNFVRIFLVIFLYNLIWFYKQGANNAEFWTFALLFNGSSSWIIEKSAVAGVLRLHEAYMESLQRHDKFIYEAGVNMY